MTNQDALAARRSDDWEDQEGFRETLLMYFTKPEDADALRRLGGLLYNVALQASMDWPDWPESTTRTELRAALADLRHLRGFLEAVGREHLVSNLEPADIALSQHAAEQAQAVEEIITGLEQRLEGEGGETEA